MLYFDDKKFWADVLEEVEKPDTESLIISSFGCYVGISDKGVNTQQQYGFDLTMQRILNNSTHLKKLVVLFSEAEPNSCTPDCPHCAAKQEKRDNRMEQHVKHWPSVSWYATSAHHLKAVIVTKTDKRLVAWTGGRNFTTSNWTDCSFRLGDEDAQSLKDHVLELVRTKSVPLSQK